MTIPIVGIKIKYNPDFVQSPALAKAEATTADRIREACAKTASKTGGQKAMSEHASVCPICGKPIVGVASKDLSTWTGELLCHAGLLCHAACIVPSTVPDKALLSPGKLYYNPDFVETGQKAKPTTACEGRQAMSKNEAVLGVLQRQAWERAKGELHAMLACEPWAAGAVSDGTIPIERYKVLEKEAEERYKHMSRCINLLVSNIEDMLA